MNTHKLNTKKRDRERVELNIRILRAQVKNARRQLTLYDENETEKPVRKRRVKKNIEKNIDTTESTVPVPANAEKTKINS